MEINNSNYDIDLDQYPIVENEEEDDDIFAENAVDNTIKEEPTPDNFLEDNKEEDNIIHLLLNQKGIQDPTKIQFENEEGEVEEIDFNTLSKEEQLAILQENAETPDITDDEIEVVNYMRENKVSFEEILQHERQKAIDEYVSENRQEVYTVDDLTDEELYKFDLQTRYPTLSDEDLDAKIAKELEQPDVFAKMTNTLREEYKGLEDAQQTEIQEQKIQEDEKTYNDLVETMIGVAESTPDLYSLDLEDEDKEEVLSFLLDRDMNGQSEFAKLLNNPQELFKLAWFAIKGEEAFDVTHEYYKKELDTVRKKGSTQPPRTVIKKSEETTKDTYGIWEK